MKRPRIGLALGSGAARGWSHIRVIESLIEADIEPDIVCGTSIGSLIGAAYIAGRLGELRQWAEAATWRDIVGLMDVRLSGGGLISGKLIVAFLRKLGIADPIENYAKPYAAIATDLVSGREIWLQSGPIDEAVRASIALPGIFGPARIGEKWLVDGGLSNPVPVSVCRALGAEVIIAVNLNGDVLGRRFEELDPQAAGAPPHVPNEFVSRLLNQLPDGLRSRCPRARLALRFLKISP
jgi:NTE family protein